MGKKESKSPLQYATEGHWWVNWFVYKTGLWATVVFATIVFAPVWIPLAVIGWLMEKMGWKHGM